MLQNIDWEKAMAIRIALFIVHGPLELEHFLMGKTAVKRTLDFGAVVDEERNIRQKNS